MYDVRGHNAGLSQESSGGSAGQSRFKVPVLKLPRPGTTDRLRVVKPLHNVAVRKSSTFVPFRLESSREYV